MTTDSQTGRARIMPITDRMANWPWWLIITLFIGLYILIEILINDETTKAFWFIIGQDPAELRTFDIAFRGLVITLTVAISAYLLALSIGLLMGLGRVSPNRIFYNIATFYVEIIRGVPMLVLLMYIAFVGVPAIIDGINVFGEWLLSFNIGLGRPLTEINTRNINNTIRVIFGLGVAYGAFSAEIFRAGIESIEAGQMEAARSLGMTYIQAMRVIIIPQAVRRVLPALGNDFIAIVKDSSLVSVLGVQDLTQLTKLYAASTFLFFQAYSLLAFFYLMMTIILTRFVRYIERRLGQSR